MLSLRVKLLLAFVAVLAIAIGIVGYATQRATAQQFQSYLVEGGDLWATRTRSILEENHVRNRSWSRVEPVLVNLSRLMGGRLVLTNGRGLVLADSELQLTGRTLPEAELGVPLALRAEGRSIGVLHVLPSRSPPPGPWAAWMQRRMREHMPGSPGPGIMGPTVSDGARPPPSPPIRALEQDFLGRVRRSLWLAGLGAGGAALLLGLVLVRQITNPLRRLSTAARHIAQGDLSQRVPVSTRDEIGELASSFNAMAEALSRQDEARHHLMADIAHELRTPLTVIQGSLEAIQDGVMVATPERLASLHEETVLLARLIDDLRDLALAEVGQLRLELAPVDLPTLLQRTVDRWQPQAAGKGVNLSLEVPAPLPQARADAQRLEQVVSNLIDNALRHTPARGRVTVSLEAHPEPGTAVIGVTDTGSGIPPEEQPRIFDRFYKGGRAHARSGSGIGLAVVRELVAMHRGRVWVDSQPGQGSRFSFTLPLLPA